MFFFSFFDDCFISNRDLTCNYSENRIKQCTVLQIVEIILTFLNIFKVKVIFAAEFWLAQADHLIASHHLITKLWVHINKSS